MNIIIAGVGGQGTVLAGRVLGRYALINNLDCKLSEVHGMSQRGGSVVTHVRMDQKVFSPVIWEGGADVLLAFEQLEAARAIHFLKSDGVAFINDVKILPMPCISGAAKYPDDIRDNLTKKVKKAYFISASDLAAKSGNIKAVNSVMLGAMTRICNLDVDIMKQAITECTPKKFLQANLAAFEAGLQAE